LAHPAAAGSSSYQNHPESVNYFLKFFNFFQVLHFGSLKPDILVLIAFSGAIRLFQNLIEMI